MKKTMKMKTILLVAATLLITACGTDISSEESALTDRVTQKTTLAEIAKAAMMFSVVQPGLGPMSGQNCGGFSLEYAPLAKSAVLGFCRNDERVKENATLSDDQVKRLLSILGKIEVQPITDADAAMPRPGCPMIGLWATSMTTTGVESFNTHINKDNAYAYAGKLDYEFEVVEDLEAFIKSTGGR